MLKTITASKQWRVIPNVALEPRKLRGQGIVNLYITPSGKALFRSRNGLKSHVRVRLGDEVFDMTHYQTYRGAQEHLDRLIEKELRLIRQSWVARSQQNLPPTNTQLTWGVA